MLANVCFEYVGIAGKRGKLKVNQWVHTRKHSLDCHKDRDMIRMT